jgi:dipeptidyl aminopeptidase/acylaminoacyl peptidase
MEASRRFECSDLLQFQLIRDLHLSPDESEVAFEVKSIDEGQDQHCSSVWLVPTRGGDPWKVTRSTGNETQPRWSPDGRSIAFLSDRTGKVQIHLIRRSGGEARQFTHFPCSVSAFEWAPDGTFLVCTVLVDLEQKPDGEDEERWTKRPVVIDSGHYKLDGVGWTTRSRTHLFRVSVEDGQEQVLAEGSFDVSTPSVSRDSRTVAFCRTRSAKHEEHLKDLWIVSADGSRATRRTSTLATVSNPTWSPDGKQIALWGTVEPGDSISQIWIVGAHAGDPHLAADQHFEPAHFPLARARGPAWLEDGQRLLFVQVERGLCNLNIIDLRNAEVRRLAHGEHQVTIFHCGKESVVFTRVSVKQPGDVHVVQQDGEEERQLTHLNPWWQKREMPRAEYRTFELPGGSTADGWVLLPRHAHERVPLLVDVHGGPHSFAELGFPYHVYWFVLCGRGVGVLALNARGSSGVDPDEAHELRGRWGELDLRDHVHAASTLKKEGLVNGAWAITGKSYGGYLAAWAVGHSNAFAAAVVSAPVTNIESHYATSDSGYFVDPFDMMGEPWESRAYRDHSPIHRAHVATTPTLFLQGEDDQRCPLGQCEEMFTRMLRARRTEVRLVVYQEAHHDLAEAGRPSQRLDYHGRIVEWVLRHCSEQSADDEETSEDGADRRSGSRKQAGAGRASEKVAASERDGQEEIETSEARQMDERQIGE